MATRSISLDNKRQSLGSRAFTYAKAGVVLLLAAFTSIAYSSPNQDGRPADSCKAMALPSSPLWIFSEAWNRGATSGAELLLSDNGRLEIQRVIPAVNQFRSDKGGPRVEASAPGTIRTLGLSEVTDKLRFPDGRIVPPRRIQGPSGLWSHKAGGYWVEFKVPWKILHVDLEADDTLRVLDSYSPEPKDLEQGYGMFPPMVSVPFGAGYLGFGDVLEAANAREVYHSAFLYFELNGHLTVFEDTKVNNKMELHDRYSLMFMPYIASNESAGFVLFLDDTPEIGRLDHGQSKIQPLPDFPDDVQVRVKLKPTNGVPGSQQAFLFYKQVEAGDFAGIYARGQNDLFLVAREAIGDGSKATWSIIRLDPLTGTALYRKQLPSSAPHLNIVPGERYWALIEKAAVTPVTRHSAPYMRVTSMVLLPSPWVESEDEPSKGADFQRLCGRF